MLKETPAFIVSEAPEPALHPGTSGHERSKEREIPGPLPTCHWAPAGPASDTKVPGVLPVPLRPSSSSSVS